MLSGTLGPLFFIFAMIFSASTFGLFQTVSSTAPTVAPTIPIIHATPVGTPSGQPATAVVIVIPVTPIPPNNNRCPVRVRAFDSVFSIGINKN